MISTRNHFSLEEIENFMKNKEHLESIVKNGYGSKSNFRRAAKNFSIKDSHLFKTNSSLKILLVNFRLCAIFTETLAILSIKLYLPIEGRTLHMKKSLQDSFGITSRQMSRIIFEHVNNIKNKVI